MVADPARVYAVVDALRATVVGAETMEDHDARSPGAVEPLHPTHEASAANLGHFVALRSEDLRDLQDELAELGLSSLGRCEAHVLSTVDAVRRALAALAGLPRPVDDAHGGLAPGFGAGQELLERKADALLGPAVPGRPTRIMVTLPSEAADDQRVVDELVDAGMDIARINCAHDDAAAWTDMAARVRAAGAARGRDVRVMMDLAGPKLRTSSMAPGPAVVRLKPERDAFGKVVAPAQARLLGAGDRQGDDAAAPSIRVEGNLLDDLVPDDVLHLVDARGKRRSMRVGFVGAHVEVSTHGTVYLVEGTELRNLRTAAVGVVGPLLPAAGHVDLDTGRIVDLVAAGSSSGGGLADVRTDVADDEQIVIGCTLHEAVDALQVGHRVFFDDGAFGGRVEALEIGPDGRRIAKVRITTGPPGGGKLRAEKGINLPDTDVPVPALSADDLVALDSVVALADVVALSFVRTPDDVRLLQAELEQRGAEDLGLVLKIETVQAFRALPDLLRAAMRTRSVGVMIARGDLAVEAGYERLAELQEEILWLCEAAHLPVIWATEVLDRLAKTGRPSRSEITDAAMSERAECVMLNKGRHITQAIVTLDDILRRMAEHQTKKRPLLRPLRSWADATD
jgi:pyruvate kinase